MCAPARRRGLQSRRLRRKARWTALNNLKRQQQCARHQRRRSCAPSCATVGTNQLCVGRLSGPHLGVNASSIMSDSSWSTMSGVGERPECGLMGECYGVPSTRATAGGLPGSAAAPSATAGPAAAPARKSCLCLLLRSVLYPVHILQSLDTGHIQGACTCWELCLEARQRGAHLCLHPLASGPQRTPVQPRHRREVPVLVLGLAPGKQFKQLGSASASSL